MILRVCICLMAGLLVTVSVAWLGALRDTGNGPTSFLTGIEGIGPPAREETPSGLSVVEGSVRARISTLTTRVDALAPMALYICGTSRLAMEEMGGPIPEPPPPPWWADVTPYWATASVRPILYSKASARTWALTNVYAAGWPMRSLRLVVVNDSSLPQPQQQVRGGLAVPHAANARLVAWRGYGVALPYQPIWPGLIVDSVAFATPFWVLLTAFPLARRRLRRRRQHCAACNYSLFGLPSGSPCPECGLGQTSLAAV